MNKFLTSILLALLPVAAAGQGNVTIPDLDAASSAGATDKIAADQSGTLKYLTLTQIGVLLDDLIANDAITEAMLKSVNAATDEYCLTYESTTGDFEWQVCTSGSGDVTDVWGCASGDCNTLTIGESEYLIGGAVDGTTDPYISIPQGADCSTVTGEGRLCWDTDDDQLYIGSGAAAVAASGGDSVSIDSVGVTNPDFVSTGDIDIVDTSNTVTMNYNEDSLAVADVADGDWGDFTIATNSATLDADVVAAAEMADADHGDFSWASGVGTIDASVIDKANFADEDWGDMSVSTNSVTLDADVVAAAEMADADHGDISWTSGVASVDADSVALTTDTTGNYAAGDAEAGSALTGDSATAFFSAGTIEHERGGLEADISAYTGLVAISGGATAEVDAKSELEAQIADVADFAEADGDTFAGAHDFGGATSVELPNSATPTTDATGEIALDTTITDHQPLWQYEAATTQDMTIIAIDTAELPALDNEIVKYDAASDKFVLEADAGAAGGDSVSIDSVEVTNPDFVSTGDVDFVDTSNTVTANLNADVIAAAEMADADHGDVAWSGGVATVQAGTATIITDGLIVEADLNADEVPTDNDILTYDTTGANFSWQTPTELALATTSHAATHSDAGSDEVTAENLATACTDAQVLGGDGSGGVECQADVSGTPGADSVGTSELDDDANTPVAGSIVVVEVGAASFDYIAQHAGTDVTADLEEETHASEHESGGGDSVNHDNLAGFLATEHVDWAGAAAGTIHTDNYIEGTAHVATGITDGLIVEADLDEDSGTPTDADVLTYDSTGANFNWIAQSGVAAGTAAALAANGGNCNAGSYPLGVDAAGAIESCTDATTEIDSAVTTHAAIADSHFTHAANLAALNTQISSALVTGAHFTPTAGVSTDHGAGSVAALTDIGDLCAGDQYIARNTGDSAWECVAEPSAGGAPTDADYLVGTANGSLSAEIVVGTSPGGELGGTWASPTLDDSVAVSSWTLTDPVFSTSAQIPNGAAPTVNADGEIAHDTTADQLVYGADPTILHPGRCETLIIENLAAADDNYPLGMKNFARTITAVGLHCAGTCTTGADISLEDRAGTAMTHTVPTHSTGSTSTTFQSVTAANSLVSGEGLRFDVDNAVSPETDTYEITVCFTVDRQ